MEVKGRPRALTLHTLREVQGDAAGMGEDAGETLEATDVAAILRVLEGKRVTEVGAPARIVARGGATLHVEVGLELPLGADVRLRVDGDPSEHDRDLYGRVVGRVPSEGLARYRLTRTGGRSG